MTSTLQTTLVQLLNATFEQCADPDPNNDLELSEAEHAALYDDAADVYQKRADAILAPYGCFLLASGEIIRRDIHEDVREWDEEAVKEELGMIDVSEVLPGQAMKYSIQLKNENIRESRPFPYNLDAEGKVLDQDFWKGDPAGLIGFQKEPDVQRVGLFFRDFTENPLKAIGMYPVFVDATGGMYCFTRPVESVQVLP